MSSIRPIVTVISSRIARSCSFSGERFVAFPCAGDCRELARLCTLYRGCFGVLFTNFCKRKFEKSETRGRREESPGKNRRKIQHRLDMRVVSFWSPVRSRTCTAAPFYYWKCVYCLSWPPPRKKDRDHRGQTARSGITDGETRESTSCRGKGAAAPRGLIECPILAPAIEAQHLFISAGQDKKCPTRGPCGRECTPNRRGERRAATRARTVGAGVVATV